MASILERLNKMREDARGSESAAPASAQDDILRRLDEMRRDARGTGGGGRGKATERQASAARRDARLAALEAAAFQPTNDMYLHPRTQDAAEAMERQQEEARTRELVNRHTANSGRTALDIQREKTEKAFRDAVMLRPLASPEYNMPEGAALAEAAQRKAEEENEKLHAMGGRYGLKEGAETVLESGSAGVVQALNGLGNFGGYLAQQLERGQAQENANMWEATGRQDYAEAERERLRELEAGGLKSYFNFGEDIIEQAAQHAAASGGAVKTAAATAQGVGGMLPSILTNIAVPGSGLWVMMAQAAGNATKEAKQSGASDENAIIYGTAVAAVEGLTEKMFGGIPGLGVGALDEAVESAITSGIKNTAAQKALLLFADALGEGAEEFTSEFADWLLNRWLVKDDNRTLAEVAPDALYAAWIGSLTSLAMTMPTEGVKAASKKALAAQMEREFERRVELTRENATESTEKGLELPAPAGTTPAPPDQTGALAAPAANGNVPAEAPKAQPESTPMELPTLEGDKNAASMPETAGKITTPAAGTPGQPAERFSFRDVPIPTYEELIQKPDVSVVDIRRSQTGSFPQERDAFLESDAAKQMYSAPVVNRDTGEGIFITPATIKHTFSNLGWEQIELAEHLPEIIENAVLTHAEPSRKAPRDMTTGVYTLFGAAQTTEGVQPVKLTVKEYNIMGQDIPQNIKDYLGSGIQPETYASVYDGKVLVLEGIEKEGSSSSAGSAELSAGLYPSEPSSEGPSGFIAPATAETTADVRPSGPSAISVKDLLSLVKGGATRYIPTPEATPAQNVPAGTIQNQNGGITNAEQGIAGAVPSGDGGADGGAIHRGGEQRGSDERAGEPGGRMERGAGARRAVAGNSNALAANQRQNIGRSLRTKKVSSTSLGVLNGTETARNTVMPEGTWDGELRTTAQKIRQRTGKNVTYVLGPIEIKGAGGRTMNVRGVWTKAGIILQADNLGASVTQIADHEIFHEIAAHDPALVKDVEERIIKTFGREELGAILDRYAEKLNGIISIGEDATPEEIEQVCARIKEELFADAYAGINAFSAHAERFETAANDVMMERWGFRSGQNERATANTTGPPERYSFAGKNAHGANSETLEAAERLEMQGVDAEDIRQETGWFRGADGLWRYEIDDSGMEYRRQGDAAYMNDPEYREYLDLWDKAVVRLEANEEELARMRELDQKYKGVVPVAMYKLANGGATLGDIIRHDALFRAYPQLRDTGVQFADLPRGTRGEYDRGNNLIRLSNELRNAPEDTLIHEIQHAIQKAEGFAKGSSTEYWADKLTEERKTWLKEADARVRDVFDAMPEEVKNKVREMHRANIGQDYDTAARIEEELYEDGYGDMLAAYQDAVFDRANEQQRQADHDVRDEAYGLYRNTAGEIEARDAASRRSMTPEQRRATRPNTGNNATVFADDEESGWNTADEYDPETASIKQQIENSRDILNGMDIVASATVPENLENKDTAAKWAAERLKPTGYQVDRQGYGVITFTKKDMDRGLRYADTPAEKAALAVLPQVLKRGIEIGGHEQHKDRPKQTITFAAPVSLNGTRGNMAVVVNKNGNHYYAHRIVLPDGSSFVFSDETKNDAAQELSRGVAVSGSHADTTSATSKQRIAQGDAEVKGLELPTPEEDAGRELYSADDDETEGLALPEIETERIPQSSAEYARMKRDGTLPDEAPKQETAKKSTAKPTAESRPVKAKNDLRQTMLNLFSIPAGRRAEMGSIIDQYADRIVKHGALSQEDIDSFFDRMYAEGVMTVPADEYAKAGRAAVEGGRIFVPEGVRADFGDDWNEFRKRAFAAGVYLTSDNADRGADSWNAELAEDFPGIFHADDLDQREMLEKIVQLAEEGKDQKMSLSEYAAMLSGEEYISEDKILDNMERQMDWALRTFAKMANLEIQLRDRTGTKIAQEREKGWQRLENERVAEAGRRAKERGRRRDMAKRQTENRALRELQQKTLKQLQWLSKNRQKAPADLRDTWNEVLGDIDIYAAGAANEMQWSGKHQATWRDLADMYTQAKKNDPNFLPSEELERIVMRLDGDKIADMDPGALADLYKAAVGLRTEFYNRNNVINDEERRMFADVYADATQEINAAPGGFTGKAADRFLNLEQLTPINALDRMAGWDTTGAFHSMARQLERGEKEMRDYRVKAERLMEDFLTEHADFARKADGQGKDGTWYELEVPELLELGMGDKPIFDKTVKVYMTPAQKVHMYLESKSYDNLRHMAGGRTFADKDLYAKGKRQEAFAQGKTVKLAPETVRKIVSDLTPEEMELARVLENYYNSFAAGKINEKSNVLYGFDKAVSGNYAPIYTNRNYVKSEIGIFDTTAEGVGNLKARQYSANPSYNISAFDAFDKHVDQTARFVGMAIPARNWQTFLNWREKNNSMGDVITHKWGEEGKQYIEDLLTTLQGGGRAGKKTLEGAADKLLGNYVSAVFGANPGIVLKQAASFPQFAAALGWKNAPNAAQLLRVDEDLINAYTSELAYRQLGYATPETAQIKNNPNALDRNKVTRFLLRGGAITAMDAATVRGAWPWAENKVRREHPELEIGSEAQVKAGESPFYKKVAEEFENAVSLTQPMYDEMHRPDIMKNGTGVMRAFTMFKTVPLQQYNTLRRMFGELGNAKRAAQNAKGEAKASAEQAYKAAATKAASAVTATLASILMLEGVEFLNQIAKNRGKKYRDDEDELTAASIGKRVARSAAGDLAGVVIGGDELTDILANWLTGEKIYDIEIPGGQQLNDVIEATGDAAETIRKIVGDGANIVANDGDLGEYFRRNAGDYAGAAKEIAEKIAMYFGGLPAENIEKYVMGITQNVSPELYAAMQDVFDTTTKDDLKGMSGEALVGRVGRIMETRGIEIGEEAAAALAELYEAGYKQAVTTNTPSSVKVNDEDRKLNAYQKQTYDLVWNKTVGDGIDKLTASVVFRSASDEDKAKMLDRLYDYAAEKAKETLFDDYETKSGTEKADAMFAAGADGSDWAAWSVSSSGEKRGTQYEQILTSDMSDTARLAAIGNIIGTDMTTDAGNPTQWAKLNTAIDDGYSVNDAIGMLQDGSLDTYIKWKDSDAKKAGVKANTYIKFKETAKSIESDKDANGKSVSGSKKKKVMAYIDTLPLTSAQQDALSYDEGYAAGTIGDAPWHGGDPLALSLPGEDDEEETPTRNVPKLKG